jgi:oligoribonuclease
VSISDRLIWVDIETTGLIPGAEVILEVGCKVTDIDLTLIDDFQVAIWDSPRYEDAWNNSDQFVKDMHTTSGLHEECMTSGVTLTQARGAFKDFLTGFGVGILQPEETQPSEPMCGSSVAFDRKFLDYYMPESSSLFGYRNVDISTIKELCKALAPTIYEDVPTPAGLHRVLPDLDDTIGEFTFYRDNFLVIP